LAALAEWETDLLGPPRKDEEVRSSWMVLGLAVTVQPDPSMADATYELRVDDETFHIRSHQGHLQPHHGPAATADARITMTTRTLAAIASRELDIPSRQAERLIAVEGDATGAEELLKALRQSA
jgi:hypothetical protein